MNRDTEILLQWCVVILFAGFLFGAGNDVAHLVMTVIFGDRAI